MTVSFDVHGARLEDVLLHAFGESAEDAPAQGHDLLHFPLVGQVVGSELREQVVAARLEAVFPVTDFAVVAGRRRLDQAQHAQVVLYGEVYVRLGQGRSQQRIAQNKVLKIVKFTGIYSY